jgi:hypothetical protein
LPYPETAQAGTTPQRFAGKTNRLNELEVPRDLDGTR